MWLQCQNKEGKSFTIAVCLLMKLIYLVDSIDVNSNREYDLYGIEHIFVYP